MKIRYYIVNGTELSGNDYRGLIESTRYNIKKQEETLKKLVNQQENKEGKEFWRIEKIIKTESKKKEKFLKKMEEIKKAQIIEKEIKWKE